MRDSVRAAWITGILGLIGAIAAAFIARPFLNEVTGTNDQIERLQYHNASLDSSNQALVLDNQSLRVEVVSLQARIQRLENNLREVGSGAIQVPPSGVGPGLPVGCDANSTFQCAYPLSVGSQYSGVLRKNSYFRIDLEPGLYAATLNPMPNNNVVILSVHSGDYGEVQRRRFDPGQPGTFEFEVPRQGHYYMKAHLYNTIFEGKETFGLSVVRR